MRWTSWLKLSYSLVFLLGAVSLNAAPIPQDFKNFKRNHLKSQKTHSSKYSPYIRVRLMKLKRNVHISGHDISLQGQKPKFSPVGLNLSRDLKISFLRQEGRVKWLIADDKKNGRLESVVGNPLALKGELMRVGRQMSPSRLLLFARGQSHVEVVAVLDLEKYLLGVLAGEMPASWPLEALKAQAVASRSYAYFNRQQRKSNRFHVESTIRDQVFDFHGSRMLSKKFKDKIRRAVNETSGEMLFQNNGQVLQAFYHADCGGQTAHSSEVWPDRNSVIAVKDPYCPSTPFRAWKYQISQSRFVNMMGLPKDAIEKIRVASFSQSGRNDQILVKFKNGNTRTLSAHQMRHRLGTSLVKSTRFKIHFENQNLRFVGQGYGHGVGLCQWGSKSMAMYGKNYRQILAHYYPEMTLMRKQSLPDNVIIAKDTVNSDSL